MISELVTENIENHYLFLIMSTIVGALACQKNSYLKSLNATVVKSYEYTLPMSLQDKQNVNAKKKAAKPSTVHAVELSDTVLFPEGGGQPYDQGRLIYDKDEVKVTQVLRNKLTAVHVTEEVVPEGTDVRIELDWPRRFDHMQQHSGQHLLSAVFDQYDLPSLSWSMGEVLNYVELPRKVDEETLEEVSQKVNDYIEQNLDIVTLTPDINLGDFDKSKLPDDYDFTQGIFRVVCIGDIDYNPCCGTHLLKTGEIQAVSVLHQTGVRGGHSRVYFTCGARVPKYLRQAHMLLKDVAGSQLLCQIEEVAEKVEQLNMNYRKTLSRELNLLREIAASEASRIYSANKSVGFAYRADNNAEYLNSISKEISTLVNKDKSGHEFNSTVVLLNGEYPGGGMVKVSGPRTEEIAKELKERISKLKGGGKGAFQGKIERYEKGELEGVLMWLESLGE